VRNLAKLALFFCSTFIITFLAVTAIRFLSLRVEWAKILPARPETTMTMMLAAAHWALSLSLLSSIIIAVNYAVRRSCLALSTILCVMTLSFFFCFGISFALHQWKPIPSAGSPVTQLGGRGLILTNELSKNETAVVLLRGTAEPLGPRVIAIPDQPLVYHPIASSSITLPPVPFADDTPWFLRSISMDIRLNAEIFQQKFAEGFFSYFIYVGLFIFLLCSLGYVVKFSVWPLANLFLAALVFRGVLALIIFLNTPEMQDIIGSFLNNMALAAFALPLLFAGFGLLVNLYSLLAFAAKRRDDDD